MMLRNFISNWLIWFIGKVHKTINLRHDCYTTYKSLMNQLKKQFPNSNIFIGDDKIYMINREDVKSILKLNLSIYRKYITEKFDCEDYADVFKGMFKLFYGNYGFGTVAVDAPFGRHKLNCYIDEFGKFNYIEPQTNDVFSKQEGDKKGYKPFDIQL